MAETDRRFSRAPLFGEVLFDIQRKALGGSADVVLVHRIRSDAGEFRASEGLRLAALGLGDYDADRFAA